MGNTVKTILVGVLTLLIFIVGRVFYQDSYGDFRVYYEAAQSMQITGDPYNAADASMSYLYPPITVLLFYPFVYFEVMVAEKLWLIVSVFFFCLSIYCLFRLLNISWKSYEGLIYLILITLFFPLKFTLGMGQINSIILLLLILFLYWYKRWKAMAGFFLSLAAIIKVSPLLLIGYLFYKKEWEIITAVCITIAISGIVSLILFPFPTEKYFLSILPSLSSSWPTAYYNQALTGFLGRLSLSHEVLPYIRLLFVSMMVLTTAWIIKLSDKNRSVFIEIGSIFPLLLLISSFSWQHHFILLIPSYILLSHYLLQQKVKQRSIFLFVLLISYLFVGYNIKQPENFSMLVQSHVFYGTLILWGLYVYVLLKKI